MDADLVIPAGDADALREIASWDGFRPATFAASDFPVDVVRFAGSSSRPVVVSRARRAETPEGPSREPPVPRRGGLRARWPASRRGWPWPTAGRLDLSAGPSSWASSTSRRTPSRTAASTSTADRAVEARPARCSRPAPRSWTSAASRRGPSTYGDGRGELSAEEEIARVVPVIAGIRERIGRARSRSTPARPRVARAAVAAGADLVNDVTAGRFDPAMLPAAVAECGRRRSSSCT